MAETLSSGLTLIIPTEGDQNWASSIKNNCFQKVSEHDHTGGGKGLQINAGAIAAGAVALSQLANIATDRLIGRDTAGTGVPESIAVNSGLEFSGAGAIQRSALTGHVTAPAGGNVTAIANGVITAAMMNLAFTSWTPVVSTLASTMTLGSASFGHAKYMILGKLFFYTFSYSVTLGGTAENYLRFTLPFAIVNQNLSGGVTVNNSGLRGGFTSFGSTTAIDIYTANAANYQLIASTIIASGFAELA